MAGRYVLDTNVVSAVLSGEPEAVARWTSADELLLPVTVLGELLYGIRGGSRPTAGEAKLAALVEAARIVECNRSVAGHYADIKNELRRRGRPIPENDLWVAAVCRDTGEVLATRDRHFDEVVGLLRDEWR